ncbi:NB-ARC domain-containing protein [Nostoc sp. CALU 546]|uniref:NB-ARC domain-containing protein n=1 Tax=Nostoc sp. CALU 546 TaxID=1867241 RepID=UPI003B66B695
MDFNATQKLNSIALSSGTPRERGFKASKNLVAVTFEEALVIINDLVCANRGRGLSKPEISVIKGAWDNCGYEKIAQDSGYTLNYLQRVVGARLWTTLSKIIGNGEQITKKNLRLFLEQLTQDHNVQSTSSKEQGCIVKGLVQVLERKCLDTSSFYGREEELSKLKELIIKRRCVSLIGIAGIGKSTLAAKLIEELSTESQPKFDSIIWKSVAHAPPLQELLADIMELVQSNEPDLDLPKYTQAMISLLIKQLQSRRFLIVLDECESLFQANSLEQRLEYKLFLRRLTEELDQSCLLLTSRVLPDEINDLIEIGLPVEYLKIEGLKNNAAVQFLSTQGLIDLEKCNELIHTYRGNPSELKAVVNRINNLFGSSEKFFEHKTTLVSRQFQVMLDKTFGQVLNEVQRQIMIYLAEKVFSDPQPVAITILLNELNPSKNSGVSDSELILALEKLVNMILIEKEIDPITREAHFSLQPVIKKYIMTDPTGLVHISNASPNLAIAS